MVIKKYLVKNMNEAMTRIRYELGKDAIIISQRRVREDGVRGYFSPKLIEVTAALESKNANSKPTSQGKVEDNFQESLNNIKKLMVDKIKEEPKKVQNTVEKSDKKVVGLESEVREMKDLLNKILKNTAQDEVVDQFLVKAKELDISDDYQEELKAIYEASDNSEESLKDYIGKDFEIINEDLRGNIVLVGPTGVGKTTTIAKLAGRLALLENKKVGLITIDTYRIGAVEQLKTYAEIMDIPFKVVITIKEMEEAVRNMKDLDVVLIDTTGRSSKNTMQISELRAFVQKAEPDHTLMVVSGITKNKDIKTILKGYEILQYDKVIITKLDETTTYGSLYTIIKEAKKPIAYVTTGQNVPADIKTPTKEEVLKLILGEEILC